MTSSQAACLRGALQVGYHLLDRGSSALVAVEQTIRILERSGLFNAGNGAHRQLDGVRRMDASIMEGECLRAGAVASIEDIVHPITAALLVMEETAHVLLVGPLATKFAKHHRIELQKRHTARGRISYGSMLKQMTTKGGSAWNSRGGCAGPVWDSRCRCLDWGDRSYAARTSRGYADHRLRGVC